MMLGEHMEVPMSAIKENKTKQQLNDEKTRTIDEALEILAHIRQLENDLVKYGSDCIDKYVDEDWLDKLVA